MTPLGGVGSIPISSPNSDLKPADIPPLGALKGLGYEPFIGKNEVNIRELKEMRQAAAYKKEQLDFVGQLKNAHE